MPKKTTQESLNKENPFNIWEALRLRFQNRFSTGGEWVYIQEVSPATGFARCRCDALAINCYESRGHEIHGIEVKQHRSDWLRELKDSGKSEQMIRMCDRWWLAVSDESIAKKEELPKGWGLLVPSGKVLRAKVQAPLLKPKPVDRKFLCSLLRKSDEQARAYFKEFYRPKNQADIGSQKYNEGVEDGKRIARTEAQLIQQQLDTYKKCIADFEKASGVTMRLYNGHQVGEIFHLISDVSRVKTLRDQIEKDLQATNFTQEQLRMLLSGLEKILDHTEPGIEADFEVELPLEKN